MEEDQANVMGMRPRIGMGATGLHTHLICVPLVFSKQERTMNQSKLDQLEASRIKLVDRLVAETERGLRADMKRIDEIGRLMQENCKEVFREITGRDLTGPG